MPCPALSPLVFLVSTLLAQSSTPGTRSPLEPAAWGVVYDVPATKDVRVENVVYHRSGERELTLDIYRLPTARGPLPAVVFLNAIGDRLPDRVKDWGIYSSWPRLVGALGMAGISMDCDGDDVQASMAAAFAFLEREGAKHGVDGTRLGTYAASANCTEAAVFLMGERAPKGVKCAAFFYGWPDAEPRRDLPVLNITAGSDLAGSREFLARQWQRVLDEGAPWTFELATGLPHAFDAFSDNDASRATVQRAIAFWKSHLEPLPQLASPPSPEREILAASYGNDIPRLLELLGRWIAAHPDRPEGYALRGMTLSRLQRGQEGKPDLEKALALGSQEPGVHGILGMILAYEQKPAPAVEHMRIAIAGGYRGSELYGALGHAQLVLGQNEDAVRSYEEALRMGIPPGANTLGLANFNLACGYTRLGRKDDALTALEHAVEAGFTRRQAFESDADLRSLHEEERFLMLMDRLGGG
jgi:tetratricopeptide (TPR) repeat protein